jgi:hypothetical protein
MDIPISFTDKIKQPAAQNFTGYPYRISAGDLDRNFAYAALDAEDGYIEEEKGARDYRVRKLKFPPIPETGTHVLGAVDGELTWIETVDCEPEEE